MAYQSHPHHRSQAYASQKSQWTISIAQETALYACAVERQWQHQGCYWGVMIVNQTLEYVGVTPSPSAIAIKLAKFVGAGNDWHGYPVAHWRAPWDKPGEAVLKAWREAGYINGPTFAKIHRGKRCDL
jgi:hypothetical protein